MSLLGSPFDLASRVSRLGDYKVSRKVGPPSRVYTNIGGFRHLGVITCLGGGGGGAGVLIMKITRSLCPKPQTYIWGHSGKKPKKGSGLGFNSLREFWFSEGVETPGHHLRPRLSSVIFGLGRPGLFLLGKLWPSRHQESSLTASGPEHVDRELGCFRVWGSGLGFRV